MAGGESSQDTKVKEEQTPSNTSTDNDKNVVQNTSSRWTSFKAHLNETVSHETSTTPLAWQALLTGLVDALIYSKSAIWVGFQTGNMVQFSQNIAQYMLPQAQKFPLLTLERALSIISFIVASFVGAKLGNRFGHSNRAWLIVSAVIQSIFLFGASAILLAYPEHTPPDFGHFPPVIVLCSLSMGMQSIASQKLTSPAFATTVAFTATLTQIASDPFLFHLGLAPVEQARTSLKRRRIERRRKRAQTLEGQQRSDDKDEEPLPPPSKPKTLGRDRRMFGIFALTTGAGVAECLIQSKAGVRGGLTVAAGFKLIQALLWLLPAKA